MSNSNGEITWTNLIGDINRVSISRVIGTRTALATGWFAPIDAGFANISALGAGYRNWKSQGGTVVTLEGTLLSRVASFVFTSGATTITMTCLQLGCTSTSTSISFMSPDLTAVLGTSQSANVSLAYLQPGTPQREVGGSESADATIFAVPDSTQIEQPSSSSAYSATVGVQLSQNLAYSPPAGWNIDTMLLCTNSNCTNFASSASGSGWSASVSRGRLTFLGTATAPLAEVHYRVADNVGNVAVGTFRFAVQLGAAPSASNLQDFAGGTRASGEFAFTGQGGAGIAVSSGSPNVEVLSGSIWANTANQAGVTVSISGNRIVWSGATSVANEFRYRVSDAAGQVVERSLTILPVQQPGITLQHRFVAQSDQSGVYTFPIVPDLGAVARANGVTVTGISICSPSVMSATSASLADCGSNSYSDTGSGGSKLSWRIDSQQMRLEVPAASTPAFSRTIVIGVTNSLGMIGYSGVEISVVPPPLPLVGQMAFTGSFGNSVSDGGDLWRSASPGSFSAPVVSVRLGEEFLICPPSGADCTPGASVSQMTFDDGSRATLGSDHIITFQPPSTAVNAGSIQRALQVMVTNVATLDDGSVVTRSQIGSVEFTITAATAPAAMSDTFELTSGESVILDILGNDRSLSYPLDSNFQLCDSDGQACPGDQSVTRFLGGQTIVFRLVNGQSGGYSLNVDASSRPTQGSVTAFYRVKDSRPGPDVWSAWTPIVITVVPGASLPGNPVFGGPSSGPASGSSSAVPVQVVGSRPQSSAAVLMAPAIIQLSGVKSTALTESVAGVRREVMAPGANSVDLVTELKGFAPKQVEGDAHLALVGGEVVVTGTDFAAGSFDAELIPELAGSVGRAMRTGIEPLAVNLVVSPRVGGLSVAIPLGTQPGIYRLRIISQGGVAAPGSLLIRLNVQTPVSRKSYVQVLKAVPKPMPVNRRAIVAMLKVIRATTAAGPMGRCVVVVSHSVKVEAVPARIMGVAYAAAIAQRLNQQAPCEVRVDKGSAIRGLKVGLEFTRLEVPDAPLVRV
ncbi:MAG: hypothetical protein ACKOAF_00290 [Actinomycetes bacterium]